MAVVVLSVEPHTRLGRASSLALHRTHRLQNPSISTDHPFISHHHHTHTAHLLMGSSTSSSRHGRRRPCGLPSLLLLLLLSLCFFFIVAATATAAAAAAATEEEVFTEADVPDMVAQAEEWVNKRMFDEAKVRGREGGRERAWEADGIQGKRREGARPGWIGGGRLSS